jgi:hypothetical protein
MQHSILVFDRQRLMLRGVHVALPAKRVRVPLASFLVPL